MSSAPAFLAEGGEMGALIRTHDWAATPLGSPDTWPQSLRTAVALMIRLPQPAVLVWGPEQISLYNDGYVPILGIKHPAGLGRPAPVLWREVWDTIGPLNDAVLAGRAQFFENMPFELAGRDRPQSWFSFSYTPILDEDAAVAGFLCVAIETTQAVLSKRDLDGEFKDAQQLIARKEQAERQQRVLQQEMAHRIKNTLSMVMAIVSQTMRHADTMEEASVTIGERVSALSNAQDLLRQSTYTSAPIHDVVAGALKVHLESPDRIDIRGEPLDLPSHAALGLSLALHELATNATKYGALSCDEGRITVEWSRDADDGFRFEWRETGGPPATPPKKRGFGSRLINTIVPSYFDGKGHTKYEPSGLHYALVGTVIGESAR